MFPWTVQFQASLRCGGHILTWKNWPGIWKVFQSEIYQAELLLGGRGPKASPTCLKGQSSAQHRWAEGTRACLVVGSELHHVDCAVIQAQDGVAGLACWYCDQPWEGWELGRG